MKNDNTMHTSTLRVSPTCCLKNGHGMHVEYLGKTKTKQKDHSPSMTLSWLPIQNDLVPQNLLRYLAQLLSWSYDDPRLSRLTSKHKIVYQMQW